MWMGVDEGLGCVHGEKVVGCESETAGVELSRDVEAE